MRLVLADAGEAPDGSTSERLRSCSCPCGTSDGRACPVAGKAALAAGEDPAGCPERLASISAALVLPTEDNRFFSIWLMLMFAGQLTLT